MTAKNRIPQHAIDKLKKIRETATMKTAGFGFPDEMITTSQRLSNEPRDGLDSNTVSIDALIKAETRLWRQSWIIGPLDELIAWATGADNDA